MSVRLGPVAGVVGLLAGVEFTSGVLQGYYTPLLTDIARHLDVPDADVNWLEGAQLILAALVVPVLAKLGDSFGHKRMLALATTATALASFGLVVAPNFGVFLVAWALQGFAAAWLPLEIALVWARSRSLATPAAVTASAAAVLVAALETGAIAGALTGGALSGLPMPLVLLVPALAVAACAVLVIVGVRDAPPAGDPVVDTGGIVLLSLALVSFTGGLTLLRIHGVAAPWPWLALAAGVLLIVPFARHARRHPDPLIDVRMFTDPALWPVFLTAGLFGMSVLGAQAPLSTFARTDPGEVGYGLGATGFSVSLLIGAYVLSLAVGALLSAPIARRCSPRLTLIGAALMVGAGYLLFLPFHASYGQVIANMIVAGLGSGALVAALPAAAATAAPEGQTGVATGLTNSVKTVGGAIASAVFGIALLQGATHATAGSFEGYVVVWLVCGGSALAAAACLFVVPAGAFGDRPAASAGAAPRP